MCKILIVEDDAAFGAMLKNWFDKNGFEALLLSGVEQAKKELHKNDFNLVLSDLRLPDGDGIMLLAWIKERMTALPVIIMTGYAEIQSAVSAIKLGAFDFLEKPVNPSILKQKIEQAIQAKHAPVPILKEKESRYGMVVGKNYVAKKLLEMVQMVAPTRMSVLIFGESGIGKEYVAHQIHELSDRRGAPFIAVDCGGLSRDLAPSELFGHLKGSFTSAIADTKGVFEQANGGTIFLDEVGNLPYEVQMQLLRALQEKKVRPVGAASDISVDVRIIVATNDDLEQAIADGRFREDLYYRLNEFSITVPPLRERKDDIPLFAEHFLREANAELGKIIQGISKETLQILDDYMWNGNLRELRNVIRRAALFTTGTMITPDNLPLLSAPSLKNRIETVKPLRPENERELIETALRRANGNKTEAARILQIDRKTLYNKMHQYGIEL
ncbi:MAG: sigma-54 dependent transcriptional regulator [Prevotellaceae bacterium]|jgi:two-component system response regulator HydG|nr:sigma-54 dependent transcriptional regulator [Prevotellaceae bacterium]